MRKAHGDWRFLRHSRERGNPVRESLDRVYHCFYLGLLDSRVRGNDKQGSPEPAPLQRARLMVKGTLFLAVSITRHGTSKAAARHGQWTAYRYAKASLALRWSS
jgi:hypothetical protein